MKEYKPLEIKKFATKSYKNTELKRLKRFKEDKSVDLKHPCTDIRICREHPNIVAAFSFDRIFHMDLYNEVMHEKYPQLTDSITAGAIRKDGKLIYAGLANGVVNIYDAGKRLCLRNYKGFHKLQINSIDIAEDSIHFATSSNDLSFKIFDSSLLEPISSFDKAHSDYINCVRFVNENTLISAGSDKVIKLWDLRENKKKPVKTYNNNNICLDLLVLNSKDKFIASAENFLNIFDLNSDKIVHQANPIQSNIKKLVTDKEQNRLFVVPQNENFVKVLELGESLTMRSLFSLKFPKEVSSFDISQDCNRYAVGFSNGEFKIKSRNVEEEDEEIYKDQEDKDIEILDPAKYAKKTVVKNYKYFNRGQYEDNIQPDEVALAKGKKKKLQDYDKYLKRFQYHNALDSVLQSKNVELTITVLEELIDRNALKLALLNRSEEDLEILLNFVAFKIRDPKVMNILIYLFNLIIDYYMIIFGKNEKIDKLFKKIQTSIKEEIELESRLNNIKERIESVNNINELNKHISA